LVSENELRINGKPMQTLDDIKYLGFKIPESGSWDMDFDSKIQKARGTLARNRTFLSRYDVPFLLRLQVGRSLILSFLTHGQDIMSTTATHVRKLESVLLSVLRAVFNQNYDSKLSALCLIAGQQRLQSTRLISRIKNFLRITSLP